MFRTRILGLREQAAYLRLYWPAFSTKVRGSLLLSEGELTPDELCSKYSIQVKYAGGDVPEVRVLQPALQPRVAGGRIPHMYEQERLCLYLPGSGEWSGDKTIATTIIPWASLWLYFYEVWSATGKWLGGGVEPTSKSPIVKGTEKQYDRTKS